MTIEYEYKLTVIRKELMAELSSGKKTRWGRSKKPYNLSEMGPTSISLKFRVTAGEQGLALKDIPYL